ncbi:MAG: endonuclease/exonuclease/phosphatase family protein [Solirubrobacteraceae bacterium]
MRVVTWNLFHGRAVPGAGRSLQHEFAGALASWAWDVALLQEVPPWYPGPLAEAAGAVQRRALTSRNAVLPLRRWAAERWPDVVKSQGGGANAILVRSEEIVEDRAVALRRWPERRVAHGVRLASGVWVVNLHATAHSPRRAQADLDRAIDAWGGANPLVLGGDLNLRDPRGLERVATRDVDHVLVRGLVRAGAPELLDRGTLSDHPPLAVSLARP